MRVLAYISFAGVIAGCAANQGYTNPWNDMWTDIALRKRYEKFSCANCLQGYAKDPSVADRTKAPPRHDQAVVQTQTNIESTRQEAQRASAAVQELNQKIDVLENALKSNVAATNQNQALIVDQIRALKAQVEALQKPSPVRAPRSSVIVPGS